MKPHAAWPMLGCWPDQWPERGNEIAMEQSALYALRLRAQAGSGRAGRRRPFRAGGGEAEIRMLIFQLVGILADYSSAHYHPRSRNPVRLRTARRHPGRVSGANDFGPGAPSPNELSRTARVRLKPGIPYVPFFREIAARALPLDRYYLNTMAYKPDAPA